MALAKLMVFWLAGLLLATTVDSHFFWQYGQDSRNLIVLDRQKGGINLQDSNKSISIRVPACTKVAYVKMAIYEPISTPLVSYSDQLKKLRVHFKPGQSARFRYELTAKGKQIPNCSEDMKEDAGKSKKKLAWCGSNVIFCVG